MELLLAIEILAGTEKGALSGRFRLLGDASDAARVGNRRGVDGWSSRTRSPSIDPDMMSSNSSLTWRTFPSGITRSSRHGRPQTSLCTSGQPTGRFALFPQEARRPFR